ncbi:hypothetical protein [Nocardia bovistercoris]|uniref:Uncharacterized protein n=1 Tax=Nocardia bovistercoris TaxID=2785916 RepID=A0A931I8I9_9NOCA|nr:hypothetical protein [Nocardia bovistercoris]MBH0776907.1 hypothetical protein [Nocardia bovistercoris]
MTEDSTMTAINDAVTLGRSGDHIAARITLDAIWHSIGPLGDPLHRCTLAHYMADLQEDPAQALAWDIRAIDAADGLTDERTRRHDRDLDVRGFYPSLHLNLADNYRRLASFDAARREIRNARDRLTHLPEDDYGTLIRTVLDEIEASIAAGDTTARPSAPH